MNGPSRAEVNWENHASQMSFVKTTGSSETSYLSTDRSWYDHQGGNYAIPLYAVLLL